MSNVVNLAERREKRAETAEELIGRGYQACPVCQGGWFELVGGAVCFAEDGTVTGWTGKPVCVSCHPRGTA